MKIRYLVTACAISVASPALAEDDAWTGPYAGVHIGYDKAKQSGYDLAGVGWSNPAFSGFPFPAYINAVQTRPKADGISFGAQIGYNKQVNSVIVVGIELEGGLSTAKGSSARVASLLTIPPTVANFAGSSSLRIKSQVSLKTKLGYALGNTLIYGTLGATRVGIKSNMLTTESLTPPGAPGTVINALNISTTKWGAIYGAGVEHKVTDKIALRLEYTHSTPSSFGGSEITVANPYLAGFGVTNLQSYHVRQVKLDAVKFGVNFHF